MDKEVPLWLKCILIICNIPFALLGLGIWLFGMLWTVPITNILMTVAPVMAIIGCLVCCCAVKKNSCMFYSFAIMQAVILLYVNGIAGYVKHLGLRNVMKQYADRKDYRNILDLIETQLECCGTHGPDDRVFLNSTLPSSCCTYFEKASDCTIEHAHSEGCFSKLSSFIDSYALTLNGVLLGITILYLCIILACCLYYLAKVNQRRTEEEKMEMKPWV